MTAACRAHVENMAHLRPSRTVSLHVSQLQSASKVRCQAVVEPLSSVACQTKRQQTMPKKSLPGNEWLQVSDEDGRGVGRAPRN